MSGRLLSDEDGEWVSLLSDRESGGGESAACSSSDAAAAAQLLQPPSSSSSSGRPASQTCRDSDKDEDQDSRRGVHNNRATPPKGRCSKSAAATVAVVLAILIGLVVFLALTPPRDEKYRQPASSTLSSDDNATIDAVALLAHPEATPANHSRTEDASEDEGVGRKVAAKHSEGAQSSQKQVALSRADRMAKWFMPRPKRSLTDYVLFGAEPQHYMVFLRAQVRGWNGATLSSLDGEVNITLTHTGGDPRRIELNSLHLMISETHLYHIADDGSSREIGSRFSLDRPRERLVVETAEDMEEGEAYLLQIFYRTSPDLRMRGAYESWLWDEKTQRKVYAMHVTAQPMDARRWLPCFDEPRYKASLTLVINHPAGLNAHANSGLDWRYDSKKNAKDHNNNRTTSVFLPTPALPTYLYSFSINDYPAYSVVKGGVKYTTLLGRRGQQYSNKSLHILIDAVASINALHPGWMLLSPAKGDNYTMKLDMIYTPDHTGAMENHGLIIAEDGRLLTDRTTHMVRHEVAHHIFGNRITLRWWSDMWLNEGLTSKAEYEAAFASQARHLKIPPEERAVREDLFFYEQAREAMRFDVYESSAPLSRPSVLSREEAKYQFSNAYVKGSSVLRMLSKFDAEAYARTVQYLLENRSLQSFDREDFCSLYAGFSTWNESKAICDDFALQRNYPILTVSKVKGGYEVRQRRFHRGYVDETYRDEKTRFTIPLSIRWKIPRTVGLWGPPERRVMRKEDDVIFIEADAPILINADGQYYYRVIYDDYKPFYLPSNLSRNDTASRLQQLKLLDDATAAALSGYLEPTLAFKFAVHAGLQEMPVSFFVHQFRVLLGRHLAQQGIDEWPVMDIVEQLFNNGSQPGDDDIWYLPNQTVCGKEGVTTAKAALDKYTKGGLYNGNTEGLYLLECTRHTNITGAQILDWLWSSLSAYDDRIRSKDVQLAFSLAVEIIGDVDTVLRAINKKAYDIKISDDDFAFIISRIFSYLNAPVNGATISHLVRLRPEAMRTEWNLVARVIEEERMNDLEYQKLGPEVLEALLIVLREERNFDLAQLTRTEDPDEPEIRSRRVRHEKEQETLLAFEGVLEGDNPREGIAPLIRRKRRHLKPVRVPPRP